MSSFALVQSAAPRFERAIERAWQPVCVARLHYQIAWSTRGKMPVLTGRREAALTSILTELCRERGVLLQSVLVTASQVRLVVSLKPSQLAASLVRELKGRSALALFRACPDLRVALGGNLAWNDRYALATVNSRQLEKLRKRFQDAIVQD